MIRAVFFDAVGTLIEPFPSAVDVYLEIGRRHGSRLAHGEISRRFRAAFSAVDEIDWQAEWRTDEPREERRWRSIVAAVLDDVSDTEGCFRDLWQHFSRPEAWRCMDGAAELLAELERRGYSLGMASNFDARLRSVAGGLAALRPVRHFIISSEVGWRKPARAFFDCVLATAGMPAEEILFVGDDPINDEQGARAAGMNVVLLDGDSSLSGLLELLPGRNAVPPVS